MHLEGVVQEHSLACEESKTLLECYTEVCKIAFTKYCREIKIISTNTQNNTKQFGLLY